MSKYDLYLWICHQLHAPPHLSVYYLVSHSSFVNGESHSHFVSFTYLVYGNPKTVPKSFSADHSMSTQEAIASDKISWFNLRWQLNITQLLILFPSRLSSLLSTLLEKKLVSILYYTNTLQAIPIPHVLSFTYHLLQQCHGSFIQAPFAWPESVCTSI